MHIDSLYFGYRSLNRSFEACAVFSIPAANNVQLLSSSKSQVSIHIKPSSGSGIVSLIIIRHKTTTTALTLPQ